MADSEVSALTEDTAPAVDDWFYKANNAGTVDRKVQLQNLQGGVELASAELASAPSTLTTTLADVSGLTITFPAPSRAFEVVAHIPYTSIVTAAGSYVTFTLCDSANTVLEFAYGTVVANGLAVPPIRLEARLPRTGTGAYAITPGTSYTFKLRTQTVGSNATIGVPSGTGRPRIYARTL